VITDGGFNPLFYGLVITDGGFNPLSPGLMIKAGVSTAPYRTRVRLLRLKPAL